MKRPARRRGGDKLVSVDLRPNRIRVVTLNLHGFVHRLAVVDPGERLIFYPGRVIPNPGRDDVGDDHDRQYVVDSLVFRLDNAQALTYNCAGCPFCSPVRTATEVAQGAVNDAAWRLEQIARTIADGHRPGPLSRFFGWLRMKRGGRGPDGQ